ncbi:unnamed protein product [Candidula unifasciata]|uniref:Ig-like domain-containing protein n=1 Tax=Candidula unifasciata TaxID=100452 RepID=A0A8S3YPR3_9EUPU|nr:unnamed protein product [Candidula unifasciata]
MANWHICLLVSVLSIDLSRSQSEVFKPPVITQPRTRMDWYYSMYSDVTVNCSADGVPAPVYTWTVNNQPVIQTPDISFDTVTGTLKIPSFTTREQATYVCTASNSVNGNKIVSYAAPSRLWQTRTEMVDEGSISQTVPEHSYVKMQCKKKIVVGSQIKYNWYSAEKTSISLDNNRLFIDLDGNLHFTYVIVNDQILNYMCGISAAQDRAIILGTRNNVVVTGNSNISPIKPQAVYTNNGVKGMRFSTAKLECMFSGYDPQSPYIPAITWRDDSGKIIETKEPKYILSEDRRTLTITNLQEEDERTYTCEARNSAGDASAQVFLNVTSGPIFINGQPIDQTVSQYNTVQFNCDTRSASREDPPSPPAWFINGQAWGSQIDPNKFELSPDNKILTIKNVTKPNDIMCIQCNVSNSEDSILANACLNVLLPIKIEREPKLEQSIVYGDNLDFTVTASTDPAMTLSYRWEFNNKTYIGADHPPYMSFNPSTNLAYINTSSLTQEQYGEIGGTYRRVVFHLYDQKVVEINVILRDRQIGPLTGAVFDLWIIGLILALILLIIIIIIIICCICRKRQEGDYNVDKKETGAGLDPEKELKEKEFNAYSRPVYDEYAVYPDTKPPGDPEYDDAPIGGDDESLGEYGKEDVTYFNEDGSFIGIYQSKKSPPPQPNESTI